MMPYGWDDGGWGFVWMILIMVAMVVLVLIVIRAFAPGDGRKEAPRDPKDVLAERFANGEIDADEYRERLRVLQEETAQRAKR